MKAKKYFHRHQFPPFCERENTVADICTTTNSITASHQLKEQLTPVTKPSAAVVATMPIEL